MNNQNNIASLTTFLKVPYPLIIQEINSSFCIYIPKLSIYVEAISLEEAYQKLNQEKISFYERLNQMDCLHLIPPLQDEEKLWKKIEFKKILIEKSISFVLALFIILSCLAVVGHQISKGGKKIAEALIPPPQEREELRLQKFKEKLNIVSPYMREIKKALNE